MAWLNDRRPSWPDGAHPLLPVIVQDEADGTVLMLAWADPGAVEATERTGLAHFWSRSRQATWRKGETSGNELRVTGLAVDCDGDAILYRVTATGPTCHTGTRSCFDTDAGALPAPDLAVLTALERTIGSRRAANPSSSYTARLLATGTRRPAEKVTEEAGEVALAGALGTDDELANESADLLYHLLVLLAARDVPLQRVLDVLRARAR
jgi:phosphoribosyl-ATP pyrophosphohydrolase/phosphoribosyl-AMP cyclohydrolase